MTIRTKRWLSVIVGGGLGVAYYLYITSGWRWL